MAHGLSQPVQLAVTIVVALVVIVVTALGSYVLGSFLLMAGHTERRALGATLRELLREAVWAFVTQPLLPLFYLFGARLGGARVDERGAGEGVESGARASGVPVVFVHGYMQNRVGFLFLARALGRRGIGPMYGFNYPWFMTIPSNAARLARFVAQVCEETKSPVVDLVCHSMGGLVAMEMMRYEAGRGRLRVRRCVTIATPHAGVVWRGPIIGAGGPSLRRGSELLVAHASAKVVVPSLSIYSSHDNVVHPKETSQLAARGGRDVEVDGIAHLAILFSAKVADHTADFLLQPDEGMPRLEVTAGAPPPPDGRQTTDEVEMKISSFEPSAEAEPQGRGSLRDR